MNFHEFMIQKPFLLPIIGNTELICQPLLMNYKLCVDDLTCQRSSCYPPLYQFGNTQLPQNEEQQAHMVTI
jgi:hypothetical protein